MLRPNELTLEQVFVRLVDATADDDIARLAGRSAGTASADEEKVEKKAASPEYTDDVDEVMGTVDKPLTDKAGQAVNEEGDE